MCSSTISFHIAMESRSCLLVFLVILCNVLASGEHQHHHHIRHEAGNVASSNAIEERITDIDSENKLMLECQHSDYRTYIKCLKREKRQHHAAGTGGLEKRVCLDECFEIKCNTSACLRDCHARCKRRLIETYSKTVETYDCSADGSCSDSGGLQHLPNITTNIHINNVLPNGTNCAGNGTSGGSGGKGGSGVGGSGVGGSGSGGSGSGSGGSGNDAEPRISINNVINNNGPGPASSMNSDCPCPATGCNCYPFSPWQAMPQITIGFGPGPVGGGCGYPMTWPCLQRYPTPPVDCSMCSNPFLRYQCNPVCTPQEPRRNGTVYTTPRSNTTPPANYWNNGSRRY